MTEYGYAYEEIAVDATEAEAIALCEKNVRASQAWDRWRSEHAPTAEMMARAIRVDLAIANGKVWLSGWPGAQS